MEPEPQPMEKILVRAIMRIFGRPAYQGFVRFLDLKGSERVLDFGAGWGMNAKLMAEKLDKGGSITCLDISQGWMELAKRRLKDFSNAEFVLGDISKAGIPDKTFDVVVVHFVLHDVDPDIRERTVKELARVLKDDGRFVIRDPLEPGHGMKVEEIRRLMTGAGLKETSSSMVRWPFFARAYQGTWAKTQSV